MKHLTEVDLQEFIDSFERAEGEADPLLRTYTLAAEVLVNLLGLEWVKKHVFGRGAGDPFLRSQSVLVEDRFKHQDRVIALGEMLFHFQDIGGFEKRLDDLRAGSVESAVGELEGAKLLYRSEVPFRFVVPVGQKGLDYDVEIQMSGGSQIPCEMKCKIETRELSERTLTNSVVKARRQLPPNRAGVIFIKIPESWVRHPEVGKCVDNALQSSFRNTGRIGAVVLHWETWHFLDSGEGIRIVQFRPEINMHCRFDTVPLQKLVRPIREMTTPGRWGYFRDRIPI